MATIRAVAIELNVFLGFAENLAVQLIARENRYNEATATPEGSYLNTNTVIQLKRLSWSAIVDVDGKLRALHIKNGNAVVISIDTDMWNQDTADKFNSEDLEAINEALILANQN